VAIPIDDAGAGHSIAPREVGLAWWEHESARCQQWVDDGDPRLHPDFTPGWSDAQREAAQERYHACRPTHRRKLAEMERGWFDATTPPPVPCDRSSALWPAPGEPRRSVRVYRDGRVELLTGD
jgi:hypothetical protein